MPRKKAPGRIDQIAEAAIDVFTRHGFAKARISAIADLARVGPGTIYLYAESKEALFDLALRRALEDPEIWRIELPHRTPSRGEIADHAWRCLQNAAQFPQLWLAIDSPPPRHIREEVGGILRELGDWLQRYRKAIKLIERSASDWPDIAQVFYRRFWRGGVRRIAEYLGRRIREGKLPADRDPLIEAHVLVEALSWTSVHRHWGEDGAALEENQVVATVQPMLLDAIVGGK
jgi:AcrR family transcriptional regulator